MSGTVSRTVIDGALHRVYRGRLLNDPDVSAFDGHFGVQGIDGLSAALRSIPGVASELDHLDSCTQRSFRFLIGLEGSLSWSRFNLDCDENARERLVREGSLTYWIVDVSRVAPFWIDHWNCFDGQHGSVTPKLATAPSSWEWAKIVHDVHAVFDANRITHLPESTLREFVDFAAMSGGVDTRTVSIHRALFGDEY